MKQLLQSLPFVLVGAVAFHAACTEAIEDDGPPSNAPTVTNGTGYDPVCNDGIRDGVCNFLGGDPETCECFDCVEAAACTSRCQDNGTCDAQEDCTCADCFAEFGIGCEAVDPSTAETTGPGPGPSAGGGGPGSGGAGPGSGGAGPGSGGAGAGGAPGNGGAGGM